MTTPAQWPEPTLSPHLRRTLDMRTLFSIVFALWSLAAGSATYYVDFEGGSNSNSGTSEGAPWKHAPGDPRATGSVVSSLAAGDSVLFKGGGSYVLTNGGINAGWSGTSNSPITYASFGVDQAILTTGPNSATATANGFVASAFRQGLMISNLAFVNIGGIRPGDPIWSTDTEGCTTNLLTAPLGGSAISFPAGLSHSWIVNNTINGVGTWTNASPLSGTQSVSGTGISIEGGTNITIAGNQMSYMRTGIRFQGTSTRWFSQLVITNNSIGDWMVWLIDGSAAAAAARFEDVQIVGNRLFNKYQHDQSQWTGCNDAPHTDGIFLRNSGQPAVWLRTVISRNLFYSEAPSSSGGTAMIYLSEGGGGDCLVSDNIALMSHDSAFIQIAPGSRQAGGRTVWMLHNTWIGGPRAIRVTGTNHVLKIHGNIFVRNADGNTFTLANFEAWNPLESNRNVWFNYRRQAGDFYYPFYKLGTVDATGVNGWKLSGSWTDWATWRSLGFDLQSVYSDPNLLDATNSVVLSRDARIGASSPARNLAADYQSIFPQWAQWLAYDFAGTPRVEPFDAGALQFGSGGTPPPPPSPTAPGAATATTLNAGTISTP